MSLKVRSCLLTFIIAAAPAVTFADDATDLYFQEAMERYYAAPQSARTFAMEGSSVTTSSDSSSTFGNPAGLGFMRGGELAGTYIHDRISGDEFPTDMAVEQEANDGTATLAIPLGPTLHDLPRWGNLGLAWYGGSSRWNDDSFDTLTRQDQIAIAYAYAIDPDLSVGYSLAWVHDKIQSKDIFDYPMSNGFRHTLGVQWDSDATNTWGATVTVGHGQHNALYGPGITDESDTFEFGTALGWSYRWNDLTTVSIGADYRHLGSDGDTQRSIPQNFVGGDENGNLFNARAGVEYTFSDWLTLRGGYRYAGLSNYKYSRVELNDLNGSAYYNAFSLGAGFAIPVSSRYIDAIYIDYGIEYRNVGRDDWEHVVTVSVPFDLCGVEERSKA